MAGVTLTDESGCLFRPTLLGVGGGGINHFQGDKLPPLLPPRKHSDMYMHIISVFSVDTCTCRYELRCLVAL